MTEALLLEILGEKRLRNLMLKELGLDAKNRTGREVFVMIIPIRCFTCGKVIAHKYLEFQDALKSGKDSGEALDKLGLTRYCCRRMILSHAELIDEVIKFSQHT